MIRTGTYPCRDWILIRLEMPEWAAKESAKPDAEAVPE